TRSSSASSPRSCARRRPATSPVPRPWLTAACTRHSSRSPTKPKGPRMFRHVVMLRWQDSAHEEQVAAVRDGLRALPPQIPELREYTGGEDARVNEGNYDMVVVADFDDVDGYLVYRDHPAHQAVITEHIRPILADRAAVQCELVRSSTSR